MVATVVPLLAVAASWIALSGQVVGEWGNDLDFYVGAAQRWQETGALYRVEQLAGPYEAMTGVSMLYPPIVLYLFAPFLVLPGFLYWAIPLGLIAWHIALARPAWWAWPVMALLLFAPRSQAIIIWGNTGMWVAAIVAVGLRHPWASPFVLLEADIRAVRVDRDPPTVLVGRSGGAHRDEPPDAAPVVRLPGGDAEQRRRLAPGVRLFDPRLPPGDGPRCRLDRTS